MGILDRQAAELPYDDSEPMLVQDPANPNHWTYASPEVPLLRARLERGMRGVYSFEITAEGSTPTQIMALLRELETALRTEYCHD